MHAATHTHTHTTQFLTFSALCGPGYWPNAQLRPNPVLPRPVAMHRHALMLSFVYFLHVTGAIPIAFSKSVIIRTFFKLIFGTIIFSLLVGLMLMPVIFSLIPPPPVRSALMDGGHNRSHEKQADKANGVPDRRHSDSSGSDDTVGVVVDSKPELKV